jgi:hypothetical protein
MNRYTRINDLLGKHASKSFHTDKTIDKYLNRKTKYKNKIIKNHQNTDNITTYDQLSSMQQQYNPNTYIKSNNKYEYYIHNESEKESEKEYEKESEKEYEKEYEKESEFEIDSQDIDELDDELNEELTSKSAEIDFKPLDKEYEDLYVFSSDDLEVRLHYLSAKYATNMKQLQTIKKYLKLEKDFINGRLNSNDIKNFEISQTIQYHLIHFPDIPLYTKEDYIKLKDELEKYQKIIERYQKSIKILNNTNNDEIVEDNNIHLYDELINIFS